MRNLTTQRHISHLFLIDMETETQIRELANNCLEFVECLSDIFHEASHKMVSSVYSVVFALPESDTNLVRIGADIESQMKNSGLNFSVNKVRDEDMFLVKGKVGLLSCSLWRIAGTLLLNDTPIPLTAVEHIVGLANRLSQSREQLVLRKAGWFGIDFHIGLLARDSSVGYLLKGSLVRFGPNHRLEDILRSMKSNCGPGELLVIRF